MSVENRRLEGAAAIAKFLWGSTKKRRRVYYLTDHKSSGIPVKRDIWTGRLTAETRPLLAWKKAYILAHAQKLRSGSSSRAPDTLPEPRE